MWEPEHQRLELTFDEAAGFVGRYKLMAFAYEPPREGSESGAGRLYRVVYLEEAQAIEAGMEKGVAVVSFSGAFDSKQGDVAYFKVQDVPRGAAELRYQVTRFNAFQYVHYQWIAIRIQLKILFGNSVEEAFKHPACRRCDWALFKTGVPGKCFNCSK